MMLSRIVVEAGDSGPYGTYRVCFMDNSGHGEYGKAGSDALLPLIRARVESVFPYPAGPGKPVILETSGVPASERRRIREYLRTLNHG